MKRKLERIPTELRECTFIVDPIDAKDCFDLSFGSRVIGADIMLWEVNGRANQRWAFDPPIEEEADPHQNYSIRNYLSGLYLDVVD